jgi:Glycosyltransferase (GlcNAc)
VAPTIFISIAAYREFDLQTTLADCFTMAANPEELHVCVCWQHGPEESLGLFATDPRLDIIYVPYLDSQGVCWARNQIQRRWDGEPYFLQIDAHHRFARGWDRTLIDMLEQLRRDGAAKPILTGYAPAFDPEDDPAGRSSEVWGTGFDRFEPSGVVFMKPFVMPPATQPVPARFWSAHFSFSDGRFNEEVVVSPEGYFHSEEIVMGVRAWTHGYDLFTPHQTVIWHEYTRKGRTCHWDDHVDWTRRHTHAVGGYRRLFGVDGTPQESQETYGFGAVRTLHDFERYAGVEFASRGVRPHTVANGIPPDDKQDEPLSEWRSGLLTSHVADIAVDRAVLAAEGCRWRAFAHAADGSEIFREDFPTDRVESILAGQSTNATLHLTLAFCGPHRPKTWTLWAQGPTMDPRRNCVSGLWPSPSFTDVTSSTSH